MKFLDNYFKDLGNLLALNDKLMDQLIQCNHLFKKTDSKNGKVIIMGNGGSAAMSSHVTVDLTKNSQIRAVNFNEADLITCFANDYGYENWMKEALRFYSDRNDLVVLVSSSGSSANVVKAAKWSLENKLPVITFTGMDKNNPLKSINKAGLNFWVDSKAYNHIEMVHHIWLLAVVDMIIGNSIYKA